MNAGGGEPAGGVERSRAGSLWSRFSRSWARTVALGLVGAGLAAAYAHFVGCKTGTCPLTSNVWIASVYGAFVGGVVGLPQRAR